MERYPYASKEEFAGNPFANFIRGELKNTLIRVAKIDLRKYSVNSSCGQGGWAKVPWISILDPRETNTTQEGVYIVYLLSPDYKSIYLTLNQGCTRIQKTNYGEIRTKEQAMSITLENCKKCRSFLTTDNFVPNSLVWKGNYNVELYGAGAIFYKKYEIGNVPDDTILVDDLNKMMLLYDKYIENKDKINLDLGMKKTIAYTGGIQTGEINDVLGQPTETKIKIDKIKAYIKSKGFTFSDGLIENYYLCLKSKPFVILAGISGTGKTRLARLFAEAICENRNQYMQVAVRPDWSDSSDIFGYVDLNGEFTPRPVIDFVKSAMDNPEKPYFLCFDEMNLARVEYYLSDILSIIETRERDANKKVVTDKLFDKQFFGTKGGAAEKYSSLIIPDNLYIVGTVNMDETTFPFSKKVLDRANTIEFSKVDLIPQNISSGEPEKVISDNSFLKTNYILLKECLNVPKVVDYCSMLNELNAILSIAEEHVGYRIRDEVVFYIVNNNEYRLISEDEAIDNEIMQKILPRIKGSSFATKEVLIKLFNKCGTNYSGEPNDNDVGDRMLEILSEGSIKYKKSAAKIAMMVRRFEQDGFTSYWL